MPTMFTAGSVGCDGKSNASKPRLFIDNIGKGISSKKHKNGDDEGYTTENEEGGAPSNKTNTKNTKLSLLDKAKSKFDSSCAGAINKILVSKPKAKLSECSTRVTASTWESYLSPFPDNVFAHAWKQFLLLTTTAQHFKEVNTVKRNYGCVICGITVNGRSDRSYCVGRWKEHEKSPLHKETLQRQARTRILYLNAKSKTKKLIILGQREVDQGGTNQLGNISFYSESTIVKYKVAAANRGSRTISGRHRYDNLDCN